MAYLANFLDLRRPWPVLDISLHLYSEMLHFVIDFHLHLLSTGKILGIRSLATIGIARMPKGKCVNVGVLSKHNTFSLILEPPKKIYATIVQHTMAWDRDARQLEIVVEVAH